MAAGFAQAGNLASQQQQIGIQGAQQLGAFGQMQQGMAQQDINQLMAAGGLQRQLGQQALEATRQTELQRAYEPYQRAEFVKIFMLLVQQVPLLLHKQQHQVRELIH
jgi:hypothetical protein